MKETRPNVNHRHTEEAFETVLEAHLLRNGGDGIPVVAIDRLRNPEERPDLLRKSRI